MDFERARANMIEQQIRPAGVLDARVLDVLYEVRREDFVPDAYRNLAFADMEIPLGFGASMLAPKLEARIVQEVSAQPDDVVLEVGTGSGYTTALFARLAKHVYSVEIVPELSRAAAAKFAAHGITNVTLEIGDAASGWNKHAPYDVIAVSNSLPVLPPSFLDGLAPGGRMFAVVGDGPAMKATLIAKLTKDSHRTMHLFETRIPPLKNAAQPDRFVF
jgi:protein-L-isoaspartate(D-aspartate) O-methyltransferase